jgi:hypothetical protein
MAALAKVLAICAGTVGGAAACVATGVVPAPLFDPPDHHTKPAAKVSHHPRRLAEEEATASGPDYELEPTAEVESEPAPQEQGGPPEGAKKKPHHEESEPSGQVTASTPPPSESGATEYVEPAPETAGATASTSAASTSSATASTATPSSSGTASSGTAAGEFGP